MPRRQTTTPGLTVVKHNRFGYFIRHTASGLTVHRWLIRRQRDAVAAADALGQLGVDFTQSKSEVLAAMESGVEGGKAAVYRYLNSLLEHYPMTVEPLPPPTRCSQVLVCPVCGDLAFDRPPDGRGDHGCGGRRPWDDNVDGPRPRWSHLDHSPLCKRGRRPSAPVPLRRDPTAPARASIAT